ncbi:MAG: hypothetical protein KGH66_02425 [Candidatus Micrarchaeota archaeon]|nr:hypothetical protein [Candidatus Micrarchaeota archaeon]
MAMVAVVFKVYPKEGTQIEATVDNIKAKVNPANVQVEELAFGIKMAKVLFKFDDATNSSSKLEEGLRAVEGVGEVEVEEESLV